MSKVIQEGNALSLERRYEMLRSTLADYLLLQVDTFIAGLGLRAVGPAMDVLTDKSAELKIRGIKEKTQGSAEGAVEALSQNLASSMGETFNSDYSVKRGDSFRSVTLSRCGCIESVLKNAETYGLTAEQVRSIFCGSCMSSYRKAATGLDLGFRGKLSSAGCVMNFSTK